MVVCRYLITEQGDVVQIMLPVVENFGVVAGLLGDRGQGSVVVSRVGQDTLGPLKLVVVEVMLAVELVAAVVGVG